MPDERNARPVSGEIMAPGAAVAEAAKPGSQAADIVDAEFETLRPDPGDRLCASASAIGTPSAPSHGLDMLRKGDGQAARPGPMRGGPIFWAVGIGLAAGAFWVSGGHALVRPTPAVVFTPQAGPANLLTISDVASRVEDHGGRKVLFIDGKAANAGGSDFPLPPIAIEVTGNDGGITHYRLRTSPDSLPPGGQFNFSTRLEAPKEGVRAVSVSFSG